MKEGFAPIYFEAPVGEKNLLEEYCKIHHLQKTDVLRSFIRGLKVNSTPNGSIDAVGYDSSGNVVATFTVPPKLAQELSGMATKITDVSVGYQVEITDDRDDFKQNLLAHEAADIPEPQLSVKGQELLELHKINSRMKQKFEDQTLIISKEEVRPWLQSLANEAVQEIKDAESLRSIAQQLLSIAERLECQ